MRPWLACAILIGLVAACGRSDGSPPATGAVGAGGHAAGPASESTAAPFTIQIVIARYGRLIIRTRPDATCRARAALPSGGLVLAGDFLVDQYPDPGGQVIWAYRTPVEGAGTGTGRYTITCAAAGDSIDAIADFPLN